MNCRYKEVIRRKRVAAELRPYAMIKDWMDKNLTERQRNVLLFMILHLEGNHQPTVKEIASWFKVSTSTIYRDLKVLKEKGILIPNNNGGEDLTFEKVLPETKGVV